MPIILAMLIISCSIDCIISIIVELNTNLDEGQAAVLESGPSGQTLLPGK